MRALWIVLAVAALCVVAALLSDDRAPTPFAGEEPGDRTARAAAPAATDELATQREDATDRDAADGRAGAATTEAAAHTVFATITGRVVRSEDGIGFAGCRVHVERPDAPAFETTSDEQGRFSLALAEQVEHGRVAIAADGRVTRYADLDLAEGEVEQLGTIPMARGFPVPGTLVDVHGEPVSGVTLMVMGFDENVPAGRALLGVSTGVTDESGRFELTPALPAGIYEMQQFGGLSLLEPRFTISEHGVAPLQLVARRPSTIKGTVLGPDDERMRHLTVSIAGSSITNETNVVGDFVLTTFDEVRGPVDLVVAETGDWPDAPRTKARWGDQDVVVRMPRTPPIHVLVTDDQDEPVERFGYRLAKRGRVSHSAAPEAHDGGRLRLAPKGRGTFTLRVFPEADSLLASEPIDVQVTRTEQRPLRVRVERMHDAKLQVLDADGRPAAGVEVQLFRNQPDQELHAWIVDMRQPLFNATVRPNERIAAATTDAQGTASLPTPRDPTGLALRIQLPDDGHQNVRAEQLAIERRQTVTLEHKVRIGGRIELRGLDHREFCVCVFAMDGTRVHGAAFCNPDPNGRFESNPVPVGRYRLQLMSRMAIAAPGTLTVSFVPVRIGDKPVEQVVDAPADDVAFVAQRVPHGSLEGRLVRDDGGPMPPTVWLEYLDHDHGARGEFRVNAHGEFRATELRPGRYRVAIGRHDKPGLLAEVVTITKDETTKMQFGYPGHAASVRLLDRDGQANLGSAWARYGGRVREVYGDVVRFEPAPLLPVAFAATRHGPWSDAVLLRGELTVTMP